MNPSHFQHLNSAYTSLNPATSAQNRLGAVGRPVKAGRLDSNIMEIASHSKIKPESQTTDDSTEILKIASGKAKQVLTHPTKPNRAIYIPVSPKKERELREEVITAKTILEKYREKYNEDPKNIALTYKEKSDEGKRVIEENNNYYYRKSSKSDKNNFYTVITDRAVCDGEKFARDRDLNMEGRLQFALDIANGFAELHKINFLCGDVKLENLLLGDENGRKVARISDLGKTKELPEGSRYVNYTGNPRFMPPEGTLSKKGDIFGFGLMLIRIFEEPFLKPSGNLISEEAEDGEKSKKFRGIEKYIVESDKFLGTESGGRESLRARAKAFLSKPESRVKQEQKNELEKYIHHLEDALLKKYSREGVKLLIHTILSMTQLLPKDRPTAEIVKVALSLVKLEELPASVTDNKNN